MTLEATSNETTELEWFRAEKYTRRISADIREITKTLPPIHAANLKNFQLRGDAHRFPVSREEEKRRRRRRRGHAVKREIESEIVGGRDLGTLGRSTSRIRFVP